MILVQARFTGFAFRQLDELFRGAEPFETGAFLLYGKHTAGGRVNLYVREVLLPGDEAWRQQGEAHLAPSTRWMSEAIGLADEAGLGLAFIHSHPPGIGGTAFSPTDEWMHEGLVPVMLDNLGERGFASFVFHEGAIGGAAWLDGERHTVGRVAVVGDHLAFVHPRGGDAPTTGEYDRQKLLWGRRGQSMLGRLTVGVVGAGGTGSAVAEQLVRSGVRSLVLIDRDVIEASNVTRVYGSFVDLVGENKAIGLVAHLQRIWGGAVELRAVPCGVENRVAVEALVGCDVVFGCTDNHASRSVLNDVSVQHLVPVIDVGCRIGTKDGRTAGIGCEVRHVHADGPCYLCGGIIDPAAIREELLPPGERESLRREGYVQGLREQPSVIPVTTTTASYGVLKLYDTVLGIVGWNHTRLMVDLQGLDGFMVGGEPDAACICRKRLAIGDLRPAWWRDDNLNHDEFNNRGGDDRPTV